jgi:hypothetical protein
MQTAGKYHVDWILVCHCDCRRTVNCSSGCICDWDCACSYDQANMSRAVRCDVDSVTAPACMLPLQASQGLTFRPQQGLTGCRCLILQRARNQCCWWPMCTTASLSQPGLDASGGTASRSCSMQQHECCNETKYCPLWADAVHICYHCCTVPSPPCCAGCNGTFPITVAVVMPLSRLRCAGFTSSLSS